jgi:dynactin complex subunit
MAGQTEKDLRHDCAHTPDILLIKRDLQHFSDALATHGAQLTAISNKQDENYENIRKRLHQIAGDAEHRISQVAIDADKDITAVGRKVDILETHYVQTSADMRLLSHTVEEHAQKSEDRHNSIMRLLSETANTVHNHMRDEPQALKDALAPVNASLEKLQSQRWALATWALTALGVGFVGLIIYIWETRQVIP